MSYMESSALTARIRPLTELELQWVSGGSPVDSFAQSLKLNGEKIAAAGTVIAGVGVAADAGVITLPEGIALTLLGGVVAAGGALEWLIGNAWEGISDSVEVSSPYYADLTPTVSIEPGLTLIPGTDTWVPDGAGTDTWGPERLTEKEGV